MLDLNLNLINLDYYWNRFLADGRQASMCGWLEDKYGLSWQITPVEYYDLMRKADREQRARMDEELFKKVKLDIARLKAVFNNEKL
ncbi:MAG: VOC family protein [Fusobacteria bacterium]|nr:VOC family protein [Fusobacteriota bacterium]